MNEPIISPWLIYWIGRLGLIQMISCVFGILLTIGVSIFTLDKLADDYYEKDKLFSNVFKVFVCIALFFDVLAIFVPTKSEVIAMYAAKNITPANIKTAGEFTDKAIDKLIEKILKAGEAVKEK